MKKASSGWGLQGTKKKKKEAWNDGMGWWTEKGEKGRGDATVLQKLPISMCGKKEGVSEMVWVRRGEKTHQILFRRKKKKTPDRGVGLPRAWTSL